MDYISWLAWEHLVIPQEEPVDVAGEKEVKDALLRHLPPPPAPGKWLDGCNIDILACWRS